MSNMIKVTSGDLRDTSSQMNTAAQQIGEELRRIMGRVNEIASTWQGEAASAFNGYYTQFNSTWSQCEEAMNGVAQLLTGAADAYEQTESGVAGQFRG
jgi:WXG100 family type VII secretion target